MIRAGFLFDDSVTPSAEERAAWNFLSSQKSFKPQKVSFQSLIRQSAIRNVPHLLWWHFDTSTVLPQATLQPEVTSLLREFVHRGGSLFFSLLALQYVVNLGVEKVGPNVVVKGIWSEENWAPEYPDIRGFGTFLGHPIFEGLPGGTYTWNPSKGNPYCAAYYDGIIPKQGNIVAVDRQYIRLNEQRRLVCEYQFGKGRVLTVGSYFFFENQRHRFRPHLEQFASNCLTYLSQTAGKSGGQRTFWQFGERNVQQVERANGKPVKFGSAVLPILPGIQTINRDFASTERTEQFYNIGGRRILIAGKERGGVSEVWCHPVRILRNLRVAFRIGDAAPQWSHELKPQLSVRPECITRVYSIGDATIEETVFGDLHRPCGAMHFRVHSKKLSEIIVTTSIDLRLMWPLSDTATGSLTYAWDQSLQAYVISAPHAQCSTVIGSSDSPHERLAGQYSAFDITGPELSGRPTNEIAVTVAFRYRLTPDHPASAIYFAGSNFGKNEVERAYRTMAENPSSALKKQMDHYRTLLKRSVQIQSPDEEINNAYTWALTSTDRFLAETPGVGSSLFAGHGTTERGWNGGHTNSGRPGYAWYFGRDSVWTCFAVLGYGDFKTVKSVLEFLGSHQDPAGKIPHEITTSGFAHYDAADATPLYNILMGRYLRSSGDVKFVRNQLDRMMKAIAFCQSTDTDSDHLIENTNVGHGWVEGGKLFPVHTEHYLASCWAKSLEEASTIASTLGKHALARQWMADSQKACRAIERQFWNERTQCYNFGKLADGTFNEEKTLLPSVGISIGYGTRSHARRCLESYASENFSADWGTRIVGKDNPMYKPTGYHYGSVWPLFTGWTSLAEFGTGRPLQGYTHAMNNLFLYDKFAAGTIEEVLHGELLEPAGVCSHQAWSESMALQPILDGMLGIEPDALNGRLALRPYFPPDWKSIAVKNIPLGKRRIAFSMRRTGNLTRYEFQTSGTQSTTVLFQPYFPLGTRMSEVRTNGRVISRKKLAVRGFDDCPVVNFSFKATAIIEFVHSGGIALVPAHPSLTPGQQSKGLRVIDESWEQGNYGLTLEGKCGEMYSLSMFDPDSIIQSVEGGRVVKRAGDFVEMAVTFEPAEHHEVYSSKKVTFQTQL